MPALNAAAYAVRNEFFERAVRERAFTAEELEEGFSGPDGERLLGLLNAACQLIADHEHQPDPERVARVVGAACQRLDAMAEACS